MLARPSLIFLVTLTACTVGVRREKHDKLQYDDPPTTTVVAPARTAPTPTAAPTVAVDASGKIGKICTKIGCKDRYAITLATKDGGAPALGNYEIAILADGKKTSCRVEVEKGGKDSMCDSVGARPVITNEDRKASEIAVVELDASPASVEVTVTRAGKTLSKSTLTPSYKATQPNGPDCPPLCKRAEERIAL